MKCMVTIAATSAAILCGSILAFAQVAPPAGRGGAVVPPAPGERGHYWWRDQGPGGRGQANTTLPRISVKGNRFVDPDGKPILFRGLSISDPDKLKQQGHWNKELIQKVKEMGTTLLRIPVHPVAWRERGGAEYVKLLDEAIQWSTELGMYVMIDWHSIGNMTTGIYQNPMYDTTKEETYGFWRAMSQRYARNNTVAFFEFFNEPAAFGRINWEAWKTIVEDEIAIVRSNNAQAIPMVAGFDWAYDLTPLRLNPIAAEGIGYTIHPYANKRPKNPSWEAAWEADFGFAAAKYPLMATEFGGFAEPVIPGAPAPAAAAPAPGRGNDPDYGPRLINYLEKKNISWTVWCFDPEWGPTLITDWNYTLNSSGRFTKAAMAGQIQTK
jgi:endoglucanase